MNNLRLLQDQEEQMLGDESNIYQNQLQNPTPSFTTEVWNTLQPVTPASLAGFVPTSEEITDAGLVLDAENSQPKKIIEPLIVWPEGSNTVSMHEKGRPGQFNSHNGTSIWEMPLPSMTETTLTMPFQGYSSMKHLGVDVGFGFTNGIGTSENLLHSMLSNTPDAPGHGSFFLQPVGQPMDTGFSAESNGDGISIFPKITNLVPAQFENMSSWVVHRSSALTTILDVKIALEHHALTRKRKRYSSEDAGAHPYLAGTGSSYMSNYNGLGRSDITTSSMMPQHTIVPQSSGIEQRAQCNLVVDGANISQSYVNDIVQLNAIPYIEGCATVMDDPRFNYDNNQNISIDTELDIGFTHSEHM